MTTAPPPKIVADLCRALKAALVGKPAAYWAPIDPVCEALGLPWEQFEVIVAEAVRRGLVRVDGVPATSLTITLEGLAIAMEENHRR